MLRILCREASTVSFNLMSLRYSFGSDLINGEGILTSYAVVFLTNDNVACQ